MARRPEYSSTLANQIRVLSESATQQLVFPGEDLTIGYADLELNIRRCATVFSGIPEDSIVFLIAHNSSLLLSAFLGAQRAGVVPSILPPPAAAGGAFAESVRRRCTLARPGMLVVDDTVSDERLASLRPHVGRAAVLRLREMLQEEASARQRERTTHLAFIQFTSGSIQAPRGVKVSHDNLRANVAAMANAQQWGVSDVFGGWLPMFHDMGLVGLVANALYHGAGLALSDPSRFLRAPWSWIRLLSDWKVTITAAPNFAFRLCARLPDHRLAGANLSTLCGAFNGSEPIRAEDVESFVRRFRSYGLRPGVIRNVYGLAEHVLAATFPLHSDKRDCPVLAVDAEALSRLEVECDVLSSCSVRRLVSLGRALPGHTLQIVNTETRIPGGEGVIGEILLRGPSVTSGYLGEDVPLPDAQGWLATGDLGFMHDGDLYVCGRLKDVVKHGGRSVCPPDVEAIVEGVDGVRAGGAAAFACSIDGVESLGVAVESRVRGGEAVDLTRRIQQALHDGMRLTAGGVWIVPPRELPRTTSGKLQRRRLATLALSGAWGTPVRSGTNDVISAVQPSQSSARADALIKWLDEFSQRRLDSRLMDERRELEVHVALEFGNRGLFGLWCPQSLGGLGLRMPDACRVMSALGAVDLTLTTMVGIQNALVIQPILAFGTEGQRSQWLPLLASGRRLGALAITELGAGANLSGLSATLQQDGSRLLLNGRKVWSGLARWSSVILTFARHRPYGREVAGMTALLIPTDRHGVRQADEALTMGVRAIVQNDVVFDDVIVEECDIVGAAGHGLEIARAAFAAGRLMIGAGLVGLLRRACDLASEYSASRAIGPGRTLMDSEITTDVLHYLACAAEALDALVMDTAAMWDRRKGRMPEELLEAVKILAPELAWTGIDRVMQLLGGRGYMEPSLVPQWFRDARLMRIFEGPTEVLELHLAERMRNRSESLRRLMEGEYKRPDIWKDLTRAAECADGGDLGRQRLGRVVAWRVLKTVCERRAIASESLSWIDDNIRKLESYETARGSLHPYVARRPHSQSVGHRQTKGANGSLPDPGPKGTPSGPGSFTSTPPAVSLEELLSEVAGLAKLPPQPEMLDLPLGHLGIDSLRVLELSLLVERRWNRVPREGWLTSDRTIRDLYHEIQRGADAVVCTAEDRAGTAEEFVRALRAGYGLAAANRAAELSPRYRSALLRATHQVSNRVARSTIDVALVDGAGSSSRVIQRGSEAESGKAVVFSVNHYLGLNRHPEVIEAAIAATRRYGTGAGTSSVSGGFSPLHLELERRLAEFARKADGCLFPTGFTANLGGIAALIGKDGEVVVDDEVHASIIEGCRLSGAAVRTFTHNDPSGLDAILRHPTRAQRLIVVESVYSMGGPNANLREIVRLGRKHDALLMVDESHALGIYGDVGVGLAEHEGVLDQVDLYMVTLSKSLASVGGFIGGRREVCDLLRYSSRSMLFQAAIPPGSAGAALAALDLLRRGYGRDSLWDNTRYFRANLPTGIRTDGTSPIVPVYAESALGASVAASELLRRGIYTPAVTYPAVAPDASRLRFTVTAAHAREQLDAALWALTEVSPVLRSSDHAWPAQPPESSPTDHLTRLIHLLPEDAVATVNDEGVTIRIGGGRDLRVSGELSSLRAAFASGVALLHSLVAGQVSVMGSLEVLAMCCSVLGCEEVEPLVDAIEQSGARPM